MLSMPLPVPGSVSRALKLVRGSLRFPDLYHGAARCGEILLLGGIRDFLQSCLAEAAGPAQRVQIWPGSGRGAAAVSGMLPNGKKAEKDQARRLVFCHLYLYSVFI